MFYSSVVFKHKNVWHLKEHQITEITKWAKGIIIKVALLQVFKDFTFNSELSLKSPVGVTLSHPSLSLSSLVWSF